MIEALCAHDKSIEARLAAFVNSTDEHKWIPEGVLGVRKRRLVVPPDNAHSTSSHPSTGAKDASLELCMKVSTRAERQQVIPEYAKC